MSIANPTFASLLIGSEDDPKAQAELRRQQLVAVPGSSDDRVDIYRTCGLVCRTLRREDDQLVVDRAEYDAARDVEPLGDAIEYQPRLAYRVGLVVQV
jgi:hypothetical protein